MRTDTERLDWLEKEQNGLGIIHDDNQHWAVCFSGMQNIIPGDEPQDLNSIYFIEAKEFKKTIREAIDYAIDSQSEI